MCTIGFLNRLLVQNGVTLPIVPELDFLTIGGLVMGGGIESTSHIHGLFQHICLEYELVTANGEVTIANLKENADLYHSVPFSYGTLGFLTRVTLKLTPYIPYLKLTYRPTYTVEDATEVLDREANRSKYIVYFYSSLFDVCGGKLNKKGFKQFAFKPEPNYSSLNQTMVIE